MVRGAGAAAARLRAALQGVPNSRRANEALGEVLVATGRIEDGLASLEIAANLEQTNHALALRIAEVLRTQGRNTLATGWLDKALRVKATLSAAHQMYGDILFEQGRYSEARPHYESALSGDGVGLDRARVESRIEQLRTLAPQ